jgi:hypothetical protein
MTQKYAFAKTNRHSAIVMSGDTHNGVAKHLRRCKSRESISAMWFELHSTAFICDHSALGFWSNACLQ